MRLIWSMLDRCIVRDTATCITNSLILTALNERAKVAGASHDCISLLRSHSRCKLHQVLCGFGSLLALMKGVWPRIISASITSITLCRIASLLLVH